MYFALSVILFPKVETSCRIFLRIEYHKNDRMSNLITVAYRVIYSESKK